MALTTVTEATRVLETVEAAIKFDSPTSLNVFKLRDLCISYIALSRDLVEVAYHVQVAREHLEKLRVKMYEVYDAVQK